MNNLIPNFLNKISQELKVLEISRQRYAKQLAPTFSVFDYIYTDEMMLSRIISDLLNPKGKHAQGSIFLSLFFNLFSFKILNQLILNICRNKLITRELHNKRSTSAGE